MEITIQDYGFVPFFAQQTTYEELEQNRIARVTEVQRSLITVIAGCDTHTVPTDSFWQIDNPECNPTVGDWIVLSADHSRIERLLERKSLFKRVAAGEKSELQLIAANIDILFIVTSCNQEFNESRLERYLALAAEAGVFPVLVLTKTDLTDDLDDYIQRARAIQSGLSVECVNALDPGTFAGVKAWIEASSTVALVGSSGVGKSTILNTLAASEAAVTQGIREDDKKGRHTTTYRSLHRLPDGGLLIDVPGMRELKVADVDTALGSVFSDIEEIATRCRFSDCSHDAEPGCAVRVAIEGGEIEERRLRSYLGLQRESLRNNASLAEKHNKDRAFGKLIKQTIALKKDQKTPK